MSFGRREFLEEGELRARETDSRLVVILVDASSLRKGNDGPPKDRSFWWMRDPRREETPVEVKWLYGEAYESSLEKGN